jgi:two-component system cell cycle sensor histidine kinase/response regulator CckA
MAMHEMRPRATIKQELPLLPPLLVNDSQLAQVMVNLLLNAAQAFVEDDPARNCVIVRAQISERHVAISVTDNGPGIAADVLPHIFDPFFTTKPVSQGTGLGLSISHSIVTALGGELVCETGVGRGTTFTIRLPLAAESEPRSIRPSMVSPIRRGRVLLIDDDRIIARALARVVQRDHEVLAINDPREAIEILASGEQFDVIFCDLMMPFVTGPDVYRQALALDCELAKRFVFITGGAMRADIVRFLGEVPNVRIEKPLSVEHLRNVIRPFMRMEEPRAARTAAVGGAGNESS